MLRSFPNQRKEDEEIKELGQIPGNGGGEVLWVGPKGRKTGKERDQRHFPGIRSRGESSM